MTATIIALAILLALVLMIWGAINAARRDSAQAAEKTARIKDLEHAEQIHKAADAARVIRPAAPVDERLRTIGRIRD